MRVDGSFNARYPEEEGKAIAQVRQKGSIEKILHLSEDSVIFYKERGFDIYQPLFSRQVIPYETGKTGFHYPLFYAIEKVALDDENNPYFWDRLSETLDYATKLNLQTKELGSALKYAIDINPSHFKLIESLLEKSNKADVSEALALIVDEQSFRQGSSISYYTYYFCKSVTNFFSTGDLIPEISYLTDEKLDDLSKKIKSYNDSMPFQIRDPHQEYDGILFDMAAYEQKGGVETNMIPPEDSTGGENIGYCMLTDNSNGTTNW